MDFLTLFDFQKADVQLNGDFKFAFLLRHAERLPITPQDADYGAHVNITPTGRQTALATGTFFDKNKSASYFSSPIRRCRETAAAIAEAHGDIKFSDYQNIPVIERLGDFFVADYEKYLETFQTGFYEAMVQLLKTGTHPAFIPKREGAEQMLHLIQQNATADYNFFLTHDAWIVPCLHYFCNIECSPQRWINFLSGLMIQIPKNISEKAKEHFKIYPFTCMPSGFQYF